MHFGIEWAWAHGFERLGKIPSNVSIYELRCDFPFGYATFGDHKGFCNIAPEIAVTEKKKGKTEFNEICNQKAGTMRKSHWSP